jgi:hypothetical protein
MQLDMFPATDPPLNPIDLAAIARGVFQYEVADALKVMCHCGALRDKQDIDWCQEELARLLAQLRPDDVS